jgi:hypothetical protein
MSNIVHLIKDRTTGRLKPVHGATVEELYAKAQTALDAWHASKAGKAK